MSCINEMRILSIGTDCSGIEAPIEALTQLGIRYNHEWSCEIDKHAQKSITANYSPKILFDDIRVKRKLPHVDVYVCGFPCQTFSQAGKREGMGDPRGTIFYDCVRVIRVSLPKVFILENVRGLLSNDGGNTFRTILFELKKLRMYKIYWKLLNTKDYGIPQNRERIFILGFHKDYTKKPFEWPKPKPMKNIHTFIDKNSKKKDELSEYYKESVASSKGVFVDLGFIRRHNPNSYQTYAPTLMAINYLWCVPMHRYATIREKLSLQGFRKTFKQVVSDTQLSRQIGNSISVNVLKELFICIFECLYI